MRDRLHGIGIIKSCTKARILVEFSIISRYSRTRILCNSFFTILSHWLAFTDFQSQVLRIASSCYSTPTTHRSLWPLLVRMILFLHRDLSINLLGACDFEFTLY
jgi:hypothetical protein